MRRFLWMLLSLAFSLCVALPSQAQTATPAATFANGRVFINGSVILDPTKDAPGCLDFFRLNYAPDSQHFYVLLKCGSENLNAAFLFRVDGTDKRRLTADHDFVSADHALWSPDGQSLIYARANGLTGAPQQGEPENGIVRYDVQTGSKQMLLARATFDAAAWSPDGRYLAYAFVDAVGDFTFIDLLRADGSGLWELDFVGGGDPDVVLSWTAVPSGRMTLDYISTYASTEGDIQISEQPAAALGAGWKPVAPRSTYYVAGVANNDFLNVRSGPGVDKGVIYAFEPDQIGIFLTGQAQDIGVSHWVEVTVGGVKGWVNRKFLLPQLLADAAQPISIRTLATG